ncbi:MAG: heavy-metal-associated domain-containing protein [Caldilineaceae bacterium]
MTTKTYLVPNISCGHCTATIERELKFVEGLESVKAEIDSKKVTVEVADAGVLKDVEATLDEIGYPPAPSVALEI